MTDKKQKYEVYIKKDTDNVKHKDHDMSLTFVVVTPADGSSSRFDKREGIPMRFSTAGWEDIPTKFDLPLIESSRVALTKGDSEDDLEVSIFLGTVDFSPALKLATTEEQKISLGPEGQYGQFLATVKKTNSLI